MPSYDFQFPPNKRASATMKRTQASKVVEEAAETYAAIIDGEPAIRVLEEAFDTITACEGMIRKYPRSAQDAAYALVMDKGATRGDWSV